MTDETPLPDDLDHDAGIELVSLAREAIARSAYADEEPVPTPDSIPDVLAETFGAFVTIERGERLRGCVGRIDPDSGTPLWRVVTQAAIAAARNDPRCRPVDPGELDKLTVAVTVLSTPTTVDVDDPGSYPEAITVGRDGLIAAHGRNRGLLLPHVAVERDWGAEAFLTATCQKAGLPDDTWRRGDVEIRRFTARTFEERTPGGDVVERRFDRAETSDSDPSSSGGHSPHDDERSDEPVADGGRPTGGEREPAVVGRFYARSEEGLREQIEKCFHHEYGPGSIGRTGDDGPHAVVSPHAGYPFSGPIAAHAFGRLATEDIETAVVLGPNHEGVGTAAAVAPHDRWRTPLGTVPIDDDLATALVEDSDVATFDAQTHAGEHSIEVQLPFLQHCLDDVSVVPVCLTRLGRDCAEQLGRDLAGAIERIGREAVVVSSTDLTHYESHEKAVSADEPVLEAIEALDIDAIERAVTEEGHSMCGPWATIAGLTVARERGAVEGEHLQYATSGETEGPHDRVVGYCAAALY